MHGSGGAKAEHQRAAGEIEFVEGRRRNHGLQFLRENLTCILGKIEGRINPALARDISRRAVQFGGQRMLEFFRTRDRIKGQLMRIDTVFAGPGFFSCLEVGSMK